MKVFTIAGHFSRYRSLADKTLQLTFETQEPSPETMMNIQKYLLSVGFIAFSPDPFTQKEMEELDNLKVEYEDNGKSPAMRMRAVLYRLWEQSNEGYDDFNMYYKFKMENYINNLKAKLLP